MKEANELAEIWHAWKELRENVLNDLRLPTRELKFIWDFENIITNNCWHLKAKINELKKQLMNCFKQLEKLEPMKKSIKKR